MVTMTAKVYLAGPIQHAADHGKGWRQRLKKGEIDHQANVECIDPMGKYNTHEMEYKEWTEEQIVKDDLTIISDCDAVLVHWFEVPTAGTPMEVFFTQWFAPVSAAVRDLAEDEDEIREVFAEHDIPSYMANIFTALNEDVPVVIQTTVPPEEISPWLTHHADAIVENFDDAFHWIENEVNGGAAPSPELLHTEYETKVA